MRVLLAMSVALLLASSSADAGASGGDCGSVWGHYFFDGQQLRYKAHDPNTGAELGLKTLPFKKISQTRISEIEEVCINKAGKEWPSGSSLDLVVLEFKSTGPESKTVQRTFLCRDAWDGYPNAPGQDTKCVTRKKTVKRLPTSTLVTEHYIDGKLQSASD